MFYWEYQDMTNIDLGFGIFFIIVGLITLIIGFISIKAKKIIAPIKYRVLRLERETFGFWAYIILEISVGLILIIFGIFMILR